MFWGLFFIGIGIVVLINLFFGISIPIIKTAIAVFLIYLGLKMIFGGTGIRIDRKNSPSSDTNFARPEYGAAQGEREAFATVLGESKIDLTHLKKELLPKKMKFDTILGQHIVRVPKNIPVVVETSSVFGKVLLPDNNRTVMGNFVYRSPGWNGTDPALTLVVNVVLGKFELIIE